MRSRSATDVPPNFITSRAIVFPGRCERAPANGRRTALTPRAPARKGAYTYRRGAVTATSALKSATDQKNKGLTMRYIDHILQPGETLAYTTTLHWVVYLPAIGLWLLAFIAITVGGATGPFAILAALICALVGSGLAFSAWFRRWTTEIDVTDRRIVYKRGFIRRHTVEMNMDKVESVDVDQSILGRMLNYGDITIRGTGAGIEPLYNIDAPLEFRNQVTAR